VVDKYLTEVSLLAKVLCPKAKVEATIESFEDEDGHVRINPTASLNERQIEALEGKIADRCVDILIGATVFLCAAVYEPSRSGHSRDNRNPRLLADRPSNQLISLLEFLTQFMRAGASIVTSNRVQGSTRDTCLPLHHGRHPHPMVVERYQALGVRVSRIDHDGIIASKTGRRSLQVVPDVGPPAEILLQERPPLADLMTPRRVAEPESQGFPWHAASHRTAGWDIDRLDILICPFI